MLQKVNDEMIADANDVILLSDGDADVKTGFANLDDFTGGFENGRLIVMGARPGMGKTTFALSLIDNICVGDGKNCIFYSADMSAHQVVSRLIRMRGNLKRNEVVIDRISEANNQIKNANLWIDDRGSAEEFIEECRALGKEETIDLIIVDSLQFLESDTATLKNVLRELRKLAMELNCPAFVTTKVERTCENRIEHVPRISDLPDHKTIEEVADEILLLYRAAYYDCEAEEDDAMIVVAKHWKCERICIPVSFDPSIPKFSELLQVVKEDGDEQY